MNDETNHDRWREDVAAYMLGALQPAEEAELERHLEGCERCREEVRWFLPAVDALPEGVERLQPPPQLRARLLAEVRSDLPDAQTRTAPAADGPWDRAAEWVRSLGAGPMGLRPVVGVAVAALVVLAIGGYAIVGGSGGSDQGTTTISAGQAPGVTARVVMEGDGGTLHLANVKKLPDERVLEAWVQRDGEAHPVRALFVPDREGRATTTIADMEGVEVVMVTTEPPGGSKAPTSSPIVTVPIPQ